MIDFEERRDELLEKIEEMTRRKQYKALRDILVELEPADIADLFDDLPEEMLPLLFRLLPKEPAAELFVELEPDVQEMLIRGFSNTELKEVLDELYLDDAVDIVEEMPAGVVKRILKHADPDTRKSINEILKYPEDTAGALMTTEFVDLKRDMTVEDALKRIRRTGTDKETINVCYVVDPARKLLGIVSLRTILLSDEDDIIEDIMETHVISVGTLEDKEDVAQTFSKYDFIALPVVDKERRHGRHGGGGHRGYRKDGGHAADRQTLSQNERVRDLQVPYPVAPPADGLGDLHRPDHREIRGRPRCLRYPDRLYPHADGYRRKLRLAGERYGHPRHFAR